MIVLTPGGTNLESLEKIWLGTEEVCLVNPPLVL